MTKEDVPSLMFPWRCPKCGATASTCGKGGKDSCQSGGNYCEGLLCECDFNIEMTDHHGETYEDPCPSANCYHCGWSGRMPPVIKGLQTWEKKALEAGWTPPAKRANELKRVVEKPSKAKASK